MKAIEVIARAVIRVGDKLLVCQSQGTDWYFLPGGHVDFGEPAKDALKREIKEELGVDATIGALIDTVENIYDRNGTINHEMNLVFEANTDVPQFTSQEDHLQFSLIDISKLATVKLLPESLKTRLLTYLSHNHSL